MEIMCVRGHKAVGPFSSVVQRGCRTNDARHEKTDLKVFVVVIPKEGWAWHDTDFSRI